MGGVLLHADNPWTRSKMNINVGLCHSDPWCALSIGAIRPTTRRAHPDAGSAVLPGEGPISPQPLPEMPNSIRRFRG